MKGRDRIFLIGVVVLIVLGAVWVMVVSPKRKQAASLNAQVVSATTQLAAANSQVASGSGALARYSAAYASIVSLGKAVPPTEEVPSLIAQIAAVSDQKHVEFSSIVPATTPGAAASTVPASAAAAPTAFTQMPFTFTFSGSFLDFYNLFQGIDHATVVTASGGLQVSGRLLTIQSVKLSPAPSSTTTQGSEQLSGTVSATAYVLPTGQGLTAGATPGAPAGAPAAATPASGEASKSPTPPAVARVTP